MNNRNIEIFSAGCSLCTPLVNLVNEIVGDKIKVSVLDTRIEANAQHARAIGVRTLPAVAVDGKLASCCTTGGYDEELLRTVLA